jgi:hypothetical protein
MEGKEIVWGVSTLLNTAKDRETGVAAAYALFPPWEAVIVQVPALTNDPMAPETVHADAVDEV